MPRWLPRLLRRIHQLAGRGQVRLTLKAQRELAALGAGLDIQDACDVLGVLAADDFSERFQSEHTGEWMYVFKPVVAGTVVYLKVIIRAECLVVSFHEDEGEGDEEPS
jgi:Motility quorum-sensing regulator, toxin of MqsA